MPTSTLTRPLPETLTGLLTSLIAAGFTAESPDRLDAESEYFYAREQED